MPDAHAISTGNPPKAKTSLTFSEHPDFWLDLAAYPNPKIFHPFREHPGWNFNRLGMTEGFPVYKPGAHAPEFLQMWLQSP